MATAQRSMPATGRTGRGRGACHRAQSDTGTAHGIGYMATAFPTTRAALAAWRSDMGMPVGNEQETVAPHDQQVAARPPHSHREVKRAYARSSAGRMLAQETSDRLFRRRDLLG